MIIMNLYPGFSKDSRDFMRGGSDVEQKDLHEFITIVRSITVFIILL